MAELEIDQSNLPRVQEVRQCFAVLEDGVLAHSLQEQEIEQYYTTNVQKNQLVQNDIRVAKRLQDEEDEERVQQSAVVRQATRQLEEQDFEFARVVQEQIQKRAEETRRRELDDEEIAKRLQEEEEQRRIGGRSRGQDGDGEGSAAAGGSALPWPHQQHSSCPTTRWQCSTSHSRSDPTGTGGGGGVWPGGPAAQRRTTTTASRSNQRRTDSTRDRIREEPPSESLSSDSDAVFSEQQSSRVNAAPPPRRRASLRRPPERSYRSLSSRSSSLNQDRGDEGHYYYYHYDGEKRRHSSQDQDGGRREEGDGRCGGGRDSRSSWEATAGRRCGRSESVRSHDRSGDLARTWSYRDNPDKRVRFQEDAARSSSSRVWEMLGQVLRERGVAVTLGGDGAPLRIKPQSRESQVHHGRSEESHQRVFHRAAAARHSFHGDARERRRSSRRENSERDQRDDGDGRCDEEDEEEEEEVHEINGRESYLVGRRWRDEDARGESRGRGHGVARSTSERRPRRKSVERRSSSEEEQQQQQEAAARRAEWPPRRAAQRSQSLSSSSSSRSGHAAPPAAGVSPRPDPSEASLDLGALTQVLRDEELARKLQDEEEALLRSNSRAPPLPPPPPPPPRSFYPEGDFRVAQVAQDEEIARFMQKQEVQSKRRSRELEEHRATTGHHDRRAARDRQVQRERLDSEGLPSPAEDCCPENLPPSPASTSPPAQNIRNIAEELDPTFQARRRDTERRHQVEQTGPTCHPLPGSHADFPAEPTFVPPTKRQAEKPARAKPKEKKENCKQQ